MTIKYQNHISFRWSFISSVSYLKRIAQDFPDQAADPESLRFNDLQHAAEFRKLQKAYRIVSDPKKRRLYDYQISQLIRNLFPDLKRLLVKKGKSDPKWVIPFKEKVVERAIRDIPFTKEIQSLYEYRRSSESTAEQSPSPPPFHVLGNIEEKTDSQRVIPDDWRVVAAEEQLIEELLSFCEDQRSSESPAKGVSNDEPSSDNELLISSFDDDPSSRLSDDDSSNSSCDYEPRRLTPIYILRSIGFPLISPDKKSQQPEEKECDSWISC